MDFLIYYIELGLIANCLAFIIDIIIAITLIIRIGFFEIQKLSEISKEYGKINLLVIFNYFIPFYIVYLLIIEISFIIKYYNKTADSIDFIVREVDKYKFIGRFR